MSASKIVETGIKPDGSPKFAGFGGMITGYTQAERNGPEIEILDENDEQIKYYKKVVHPNDYTFNARTNSPPVVGDSAATEVTAAGGAGTGYIVTAVTKAAEENQSPVFSITARYCPPNAPE